MSRDFPDQGKRAQNFAQANSEVGAARAAFSNHRGFSHRQRGERRIYSTEENRDHEENADQREAAPGLGWKGRIKYFTWTWFTIVMSTGGVANVLHSVPFRFPGLYAIGVVFLILAIVMFLITCVLISMRFYMWPNTFRQTLIHPTESFFVCAFMISVATLLLVIAENGLQAGKTGPWLATTMVVLFWIYVACAITFSTTIYLTMWSTQSFTISRMTPVWIFPAYPLLLVGPFAGVLSEEGRGISHTRALEIIVGGVIIQGMGFLLSLTMHATYVYRLMSQKLPEESARPAMFISVGPSAFTVTGLINMGRNIQRVISSNFMGSGVLAGQVSQILAYWAGIWLFGISVFFFLLAVGAHWACIPHHRMYVSITWNAFIFPNTAFITAMFAVAIALDDNYALNVIGCVLTVLLVIVWFFVMIMLVRGVLIKQILWPFKHPGADDCFDDPEGSRPPSAYQRSSMEGEE